MSGRDSAGYYKVLNLTSNATADEIKQNYRELAKKWHPDYNKSEEAIEIFQKISVAHDILSDDKKRLTYDLACIAHGAENFPDIFSLKVYTNQHGQEDVSVREVDIEEQQGWIIGDKKKKKRLICSEKEAEKEYLKSSVKNWLLGWWTLKGFVENIRIIRSNIKTVGGKKEENLQLLVHNALAYDQEGKAQKARTCAFLAQAYADADDKNLIDKFIKQLPQTQEISVQPWNENRLKLVQFVFPFMMLILIAGGIIIKRTDILEGYYLMKGDEIDYYQQVRMQGGSSVDDMVVAKILNINSDLGSTKMLYHVKSGYSANVMYGPSDDFDKIMILANEATVRVTGISPDNAWYRIMLDNGDMGFIRTEFLEKGIGAEIPEDSKIFERK